MRKEGGILLWGTLLFMLGTGLPGRSLSWLGTAPEWERLSEFNDTLTQEVFEERMNTVYAPHADWRKWFAVSDAGVAVVMKSGDPSFRYFISFSETLQERAYSRELKGLHIALDPGHIGGEWARMEHRWFQMGEDPPVVEGELVLKVAERLKVELEVRGARVTLLREGSTPVTPARPEDFRMEAETWVAESDPDLEAGTETWREQVRARQNLLFYRVAEIRARAEVINDEIRPDLVLALHINAEAWPEGDTKVLVSDSHFHVLLNGAYMESELALDDLRFALLRKLFSRELEVERLWAEPVVEAFVEVTELPPYTYNGTNAIAIGESGYLYGRNLLANRLYECPVLFLEPFVANSETDYARIQATLRGEGGLLDDYVRSVVEGLVRP